MERSHQLKLPRSFATKVAGLVYRHYEELNTSAVEARETCTESEFMAYRAALVGVFMAMHREILEPIWEEFPELVPSDVEKWSPGSSSPND